MFRALQIEAVIHYALVPETPISLRRGGTNPVDPGMPDGQVVKHWKEGRWVPVIPGSSLKGAFRSRAEQMLKGMGFDVDDVFDKNSGSHKAKSDGNKRGEDLYFKQCAASRLFGSLALGSRIFFEDAVPRDPSAVRLGLREGVGISRLTGGPAPGVLYTYEVVEAGEFVGRIVVQNFELWHLKLLAALLEDLHTGHLRLGAATSRGLGRVRLVPEWVSLACLDYRNGPNPGTRPLEDVFGTLSARELDWKADLFRARAEVPGLEAVLDFCRGLPGPSPQTIRRIPVNTERR